MIKNPQPTPPSIHSAVFKQTAHDFIVTEMMNVEFSHDGEHCWFYIHKINLNTQFVAKLLAQWANINTGDVGFSGLKDRRASTYQWFSLRLPKKALPDGDFEQFAKDFLNDDESLSVLDKQWHNKKLNLGTHKHNHFNITLKNVMGDKHAIDEQLTHIQQTGIPNYFGHQRFGIEQNNIEHAKDFFAKLLESPKPYKPHKKDLQKHGIYISTAKSLLFNAILAQRVSSNTWDKAMTGDVFNLNGTGSIFTSNIDDEITSRLNSQDIHPTIALFGVGELKHTADALALHQSVFDDPAFELFTKGLLKVGGKISHRATRLLISELSWQWQNDDLVLDFVLPKGTFATCVIDVLVHELG